MTTLNNLIQRAASKKHATNVGIRIHDMLKHVVVDGTHIHGDETLALKIKQNPHLLKFFSANAKTEIPIVGTIDGRFISRRLDRIVINDIDQEILILDYKTDTDKKAYYKQYVRQIQEYTKLVQAIYPTHTVTGYILWTHNFLLEKIT